MIEGELECELNLLKINEDTLGLADERNCENMFGQVPIPVGLAGPLKLTLNSTENTVVHLPLATTEGALVASVNRGCKALTMSDSVRTYYERIGISRSIGLNIKNSSKDIYEFICDNEEELKKIAQSTSSHLKVLSFDIDKSGDYLFLTLYADTDEAMGMNMITIAAQKVGDWISESTGSELVTIAANVDSDKKPSKRTHDKGRGISATATAEIPSSVIEQVFKTTPEKLLKVADAKLNHGSKIAGAIGSNLHVANVIAALYLATGQDAAHVVEGSLADTTVEKSEDGIIIQTKLPAILVGTIGGGTSLPAQKQCLDLLLNNEYGVKQFAQIIAAAVLAGEISLLAAQATNTLASAHKSLGREAGK